MLSEGRKRYLREYVRKFRAMRKSKRLCVGCGKKHPDPYSKARCEDCLAARRKDDRAYQKKRTATLRIKGMCASCGRRPTKNGRWYCTVCSKTLNAKNARIIKSLRRERREKGLCVGCGKAKEHRAYAYCDSCRMNRLLKYRTHWKPLSEAEKEKRRGRAKELRDRVLRAYGSKCCCCGEPEPLFLTVDHKDGKGSEHRRFTGSQTYRYLEKHGYPKDNYQLLCYNCNCGRQKNGGICPHKTKK